MGAAHEDLSRTSDGGDIDWKEIEKLVHDSYRLIAPKRLAALLD